MAFLEDNQLIRNWSSPKAKNRSDLSVAEVKIIAARVTTAAPRIEAAKALCSKKMNVDVKKETDVAEFVPLLIKT